MISIFVTVSIFLLVACFVLASIAREWKATALEWEIAEFRQRQAKAEAFHRLNELHAQIVELQRRPRESANSKRYREVAVRLQKLAASLAWKVDRLMETIYLVSFFCDFCGERKQLSEKNNTTPEGIDVCLKCKPIEVTTMQHLIHLQR
jgi:hypothetical protein